MTKRPIRRALLSVSDKSGLVDFARGNIRLRLPAPERRLGRLVPTVDLHSGRS